MLKDAETLPYDEESPSTSLLSSQYAIFDKILNRPKNAPFILITSVIATLTRLPSPSHWIDNRIPLTLQDPFDFDAISTRLKRMGYSESYVVSQRGQYSRKDGRFDIYPFGEKHAYRLFTESGHIDAIRVLDTVAQRSGRALG